MIETQPNSTISEEQEALMFSCQSWNNGAKKHCHATTAMAKIRPY